MLEDNSGEKYLRGVKQSRDDPWKRWLFSNAIVVRPRVRVNCLFYIYPSNLAIDSERNREIDRGKLGKTHGYP